MSDPSDYGSGGDGGTYGGSSSGGGQGSVEEIEFKIYSDGRVEETVRGVRGNSCHDVTEKINSALGKVAGTKPTEELYEQELLVESNVEEKASGGGGGGGWEASSSSPGRRRKRRDR